MERLLNGRRDRESGVALVVTLGVVLIVALLILAASTSGLIDRGVSANQFRGNAAYYVAQTGIDVYKTAVFRNLVDFYEEEGQGWCESPIAGGISDGDGNVILPPNTWTDWVTFGNGRYRVRYDPAGIYFVLTSEGEVGDGRSTVQLIAGAGAGPGSAWDNAILARGASPGSKAINGNVAVYGSLHIVRGSIDGTLALSGTAGVFNDYRGNLAESTDIYDEVSSIVDPDVDLCARLKIADGNVYLESGAVQLGARDHPIYSIHLGDGIVCRAKDQATGGCKPKDIITDHHDSDLVWLKYPEEEDVNLNSPYGPYDHDLPQMLQSMLDQAFKTDVDGVPVAGCEWLYEPDPDPAEPQDPDPAEPGELRVRLPPADPSADSDVCGDGTNSVRWVAATADTPGHLVVTGWVDFPVGEVAVVGTLLYSGQGTFIVGETLDDAGASITVGGGASIRPLGFRTFPLTDALALLSTGGITFSSTAANDPSAVLMWAKGTFRAEKQVTIVGSVIAEDFDLGNNVPRIAYHPDIRLAAEDLCLPGTACAGDGVPDNPGLMADIAIERR
jgi:hypothetical protein